MKKIIIFAAALAAMTACNKSVLETATPSEGFGYINLGISTDTEMVITKAGGEETTTPGLSNYMVGLFNSEGTAIWSDDETNIKDGYATYSYVTASEQANLWKVPAGTYTVKVNDGNATTVYGETNTLGKVRVEGSNTVTVTAGVSSNCQVTCTPANAKISFITTDDFNKVFTSPSVSLKVKDDASTNKSYGTLGTSFDSAAQAYFEPVTITWTLSTTISSVSKTYSNDITLVKAKWTQVTFTTSSTNGSISLNIVVNGNITETINLNVTIDPITGAITQTNTTPSAE